mmetsp:Transcript_12716/g.26946  ORF Transcript_12716/g.26946 Transcript_12716/m.26946 type:complete len:87 (-) Transcript_12716:257-517(-)
MHRDMVPGEDFDGFIMEGIHGMGRPILVIAHGSPDQAQAQAVAVFVTKKTSNAQHRISIPVAALTDVDSRRILVLRRSESGDQTMV